MNRPAPPGPGNGASVPLNTLESPETLPQPARSYHDRATHQVSRRLGNGFRITKLLMHGDLLHWERHFIRGLSNQSRISPTQQAILDRIWRQHLEAKTS